MAGGFGDWLKGAVSGVWNGASDYVSTSVDEVGEYGSDGFPNSTGTRIWGGTKLALGAAGLVVAGIVAFPISGVSAATVGTGLLIAGGVTVAAAGVDWAGDKIGEYFSKDDPKVAQTITPNGQNPQQPSQGQAPQVQLTLQSGAVVAVPTEEVTNPQQVVAYHEYNNAVELIAQHYFQEHPEVAVARGLSVDDVNSIAQGGKTSKGESASEALTYYADPNSMEYRFSNAIRGDLAKIFDNVIAGTQFANDYQQTDKFHFSEFLVNSVLAANGVDYNYLQSQYAEYGVGPISPTVRDQNSCINTYQAGLNILSSADQTTLSAGTGTAPVVQVCR